MRYATLLRTGLIKFAMMLSLNHLCSGSLVRLLFLQLQTGRMRFVQISMQGDFGDDNRVPSLTLGFSTQMHLYIVIEIQLSQLFIGAMSRRRRGNMVITYERLRRLPLPPLVFSTTGGMGKEATVFYRRWLADLLSSRNNVIYITTLAWMRSTLSFSLLRSAAMCIRGSRSISYQSLDASPEVGLAESSRDY